MPTQVILFDGVDLSEQFSTWQEIANSRLNIVTVPRRHGALLTDTPVEDARTINITGRILANDALTLRGQLDTLSELFTRRGKKLQLWDDRYIIAYKATFQFTYVVGSAMRAADFTLQFLCPDPFWYGTSPVSTNFDLAETDIPLDITNDKYRRNITVTNPGSVYMYPTITVTPGLTPLTTVVVRNLTNSHMFQFTGTVPVGGFLTVDMANFLVNITDALGHVVEDLTDFNGDFWAFEPGVNNVQIEGTAPANYKFDFTQRYS